MAFSWWRMLEMAEASGAVIGPHKYLMPAVPLAVLRQGLGEALLWFKAAHDQEKGRDHLLTISYWDEIL